MTLKCRAVAQISNLEILNNQAPPVSSVCNASVPIAVTGEVPTRQLSAGDTCNDFTFVTRLSIQIHSWVWTSFSFSPTSTKIHAVSSLITFSSTGCEEFFLPLGTDPIPFKPTQDLAGGVGQGQGLGWELQGKFSRVRDQRAEAVFAAAKQT